MKIAELFAADPYFIPPSLRNTHVLILLSIPLLKGSEKI